MSEGDAGEGVLAGLTFALSGTLSEPRGDFENLIKSNGGATASSVTGKVRFCPVSHKHSQRDQILSSRISFHDCRDCSCSVVLIAHPDRLMALLGHLLSVYGTRGQYRHNKDHGGSRKGNPHRE